VWLFLFINLICSLRKINPSSATAIKNYVEGAEIITPQARKIIDEQKKLMPKFYKNSYFRRRNSYSSNYSGYSIQTDQ
jgi:hypothetical protein